MRRQLLVTSALVLAAATLHAQTTSREMSQQEIQEYILFNQIVRLTPAERALDVSFAHGNTGQVKPDDVVWVLDPQESGLAGIASRPIWETAKAGEKLGTLGAGALRDGAAIHVRSGQEGAYVLDHTGRLWQWQNSRAESVQVENGVTNAADLDVNSSGLIAVLWGDEVAVCLGFPAPPLWRFKLDPDLLPAVAVAVSAAGEIYVAGRGKVAVAVYDLDPAGTYRRVRAATAADLGVQAVAGIDVPPFMILPTEGKEAYVDQDRIVLLSDADAGAVLALERTNLTRIGRWDVRGQMAAAAPGRLDVSNRGQIAYVDVRAGEAQVLPTRVTIALVEPAAGIRWRNLDPNRQVFHVQGGDTLHLPSPTPKHQHGDSLQHQTPRH